MRNARLTVAMLVLVGLIAGRAAADGVADRAQMAVTFDKPQAKPGETVRWTLTLTINEGFHGYPMKQPDGSESDYRTSFVRPSFGPFVFVGEDMDAQTNAFIDEMGKKLATIERMGVWKGEFVVNPKAKPGKYPLGLRGTLPVCDHEGCTSGSPPEELFEVVAGAANVDAKYLPIVATFPISDVVSKLLAGGKKTAKASADAQTAAGAGSRGAATPTASPALDVPRVAVAPPADTIEDHEANLKSFRDQLQPFTKPTSRASGGLLGFLAAAAFWGAIALVTPCVFPMIPITVSFFLHQSQNKNHRPIKMALIYCGTIILVLGISALTLLSTFRALSIHPVMNIGMGALFIFFALSLFGMYEIMLPARLTQFTSAREGRGGVVGTIFMALTFTVVSFTCVAPFLGGFSGMAASGEFDYWELALGALTFSTTFAAPFFLLALFPSLIKQLPQSGSWLNSVKVVMGFLELAAALKFFRTAELLILPEPAYFTYDIVLGVWLALALVCGLYLLNLFRLHHDEPIAHIGVPRMLIGLLFIGFAFYILPAIFKKEGGENQRPRGAVFAWIDSFLLPEVNQTRFPFSVNLAGTVSLARQELARNPKERQFIFLDCTGVTCTNCKYNEESIFSRPDVSELLKGFRLVQHYTDEVPKQFYPQDADIDDARRLDEAKKHNLKFQKDLFGTEQLPLYVIFEVTKDKVFVRGVYEEAKINDVPEFIKFLKGARKALAK